MQHFSLLHAALIGLPDDSCYLAGHQALHDRLPVHTIFLDVDGVLTDGYLSMDGHGMMQRRYAIQDGAAIQRLKAANISVVWVSAAAPDPSILARAKMLGIPKNKVFCSI